MEHKEKEFAKSIGKRIKALREKNGESQAELGEVLYLSQNSISKIENGDVMLTLENQLGIAKHYNVSHDYICTGIDNDSILETLKKYVNLEYGTILIGDESLTCPKLKINIVFLEYLMSVAHVQNDALMPDEIRDKWLKMETDKFYTNNRNNNFENPVSVIPVVEDLIFPDDKKNEWKQSDLLREIDKQLKNQNIKKKEELK